MNKISQLRYLQKNSAYHQISGASKIIFFIFISLATFVNEKWYILLCFYVGSILLFKLSKIGWKDCSRVLVWSMLFTGLLSFLVFVSHLSGFSTSHLTEASMAAFQAYLKIRVISHVVIITVLTTHPGRLAASLNQLGIPYRISYTLSQPLRALLNSDDYFQRYDYIVRSQDYHLVGRRPPILLLRDYLKTLSLSLFQQNQDGEQLELVKDMHHFGAQVEATWYYEHHMIVWDLLLLLLGAVILSVSIMFAI